MPRELWPPEWKGQYRDPVVLLLQSLYGHPESGSHWEKHLTDQVRALGGVPVPEHPSSFWFPPRGRRGDGEQPLALGMLLTVYVDDFLLSGPEGEHERFWEELGKLIDLEDIGGLGRFLGRHHEIVEYDGGPAVSFNMSDYVKSACDLYTSFPGSKPLRFASTPYVSEGSLVASDDDIKGELAPNACKVLMKDLWVARLARPELTKAIT